MKRIAFALSAALLCGASAPLAPGAPPSYAYDSFAPLDLSIDDASTEGNVRIDSISFRSQSNIVRAVVVYPKEPPKSMAGILFAHWLGDPATTNHTEFLEDAKWLARRGATSLLLDEPWAQPDWFEKVRSSDSDARDSVATVVAMRRALDVLMSRTGIDPKRIAFVGHDFGASYGALFAGADQRVQDVVFMAPTENLARWFELDTARPPANRAAYEATMNAFDIEAGLAKGAYKACLLQFGDRDTYVPAAAAKTFAEAAPGGDKTMKVYRTDHALATDDATDDRRAWLAQRLGLS